MTIEPTMSTWLTGGNRSQVHPRFQGVFEEDGFMSRTSVLILLHTSGEGHPKTPFSAEELPDPDRPRKSSSRTASCQRRPCAWPAGCYPPAHLHGVRLQEDGLEAVQVEAVHLVGHLEDAHRLQVEVVLQPCLRTRSRRPLKEG